MGYFYAKFLGSSTNVGFSRKTLSFLVFSKQEYVRSYLYCSSKHFGKLCLLSSCDQAFLRGLAKCLGNLWTFQAKSSLRNLDCSKFASYFDVAPIAFGSIESFVGFGYFINPWDD